MSTSLKPILLGLGLVAGIAFGAPAQTVVTTPGPSIANLPPDGPRAGHNTYIPAPGQQAVAPSATYPGPGAGAWTIKDPPHFQKSAGYDEDVTMHPYKRGLSMSPR